MNRNKMEKRKTESKSKSASTRKVVVKPSIIKGPSSPDSTSNSEHRFLNNAKKSHDRRISSIPKTYKPSSSAEHSSPNTTDRLTSDWSISPPRQLRNKKQSHSESTPPLTPPKRNRRQEPAKNINKKPTEATNQKMNNKNKKVSHIDVDSETEKVVKKKPKPKIKIKTPTEKSKEVIDSVSLADDNDSREEHAKKFREYAAHCQTLTLQEIKSEFEQLPGWPQDEECTSFYNPANAEKNRYTDIRCLESSRVRLSFLNSEEPGSDYIHANYISSRHLEHRYIVTQGPKHSTIGDFWRMVWQEETTSIMMLCNFKELEKIKCVEYFPRTPKGIFNFENLPDEFFVRYENTTKERTIVITTLHLVYKGETRRVKHYQWLEWPDFEVPSSSNTLLRILSKLRSLKKPPIIHCAAGIGRSGTLIAIEIALMALQKQDSMVDVKQIVSHLRLYGRAGAVQTFEQYMLIRKVILDFGASINFIKEENYNCYTNEYIQQLASRQRSI